MKSTADINSAKLLVQKLLGKTVRLKLNKGRKKVKNFEGVVCEAHQNVFVVQLQNALFDRISCSYADVLCGEVCIAELSRAIGGSGA